MGVEDEFRNHAERCRLMAEGSAITADRAFWLLLAENWQRLAQDTEAELHREAEPLAERSQTEAKETATDNP